jgi:outer membrane receptor protein involved in Fe transport
MSNLRYGRLSLLGSCVVGILAAAAASAQQATPPASAEKPAAPPAAASAVELEEIVVTGSRIMRASALEGTIPVTSIAASELTRQGDINIGDALNDLPSLRSTYSQGNSTRFIGTAGLNFLDLRGLGVERTLVLVNGRRHVTASPGDYLVDTNTIPSELIERIDVVTGGNSSVYGSDAVAGVVNFITKRDYEGLSFRGQAGTSERGDRDSEFFSVTYGTNFADDRGNVAVALEYGNQDALYFNQRDGLTGAFRGRSQFNLSEPTAGEPGGTDGVPDNLFWNGIFNATITDGGVISPLASGNSASTVFCGNLPEPARSTRCLPNNQPRIFSFDRNGNLVQTVPTVDFRPFGSGNVQLLGAPGSNPGSLSSLRNTGQLMAGLTRYSANLLAHYDVNDAFRPFVEAKFVRIDANQEGQPSFWQGSIPGFFGAGAELRCNNPYLSSQALGVLQAMGRCAAPATGTFTISRFNVDFGGRGEEHERDTYRIVLGADGTFNDDWRYEVAFNYGKLKTSLDSLNNLVSYDIDGNPDGFSLAIDAVRNSAGQIVCRVNADADPTNDDADCVPLNVFGYGAPSKEALRYINTTAHREGEAEQYVASAYVAGDSSDWFELPAGPASFAIGAETRKEKAYEAFDELTASGATFLNAIQPFDPPDVSVNEVFGELRFPILANMPFVHELTAEGAYRWSDYDTDVGSVSAYNAGLIYAPIQDVRFRGNYSTSVRAPTQSDLYSPQSQNFAFINDPCDVLYINNNPNRAANCAAAGVPAGFVNQPARDRSTGFLSGGNPTLIEENGTSYTVGMVIMPTMLPGFAFAVDYWNIEVEDLISGLTAQTIINECYNSPNGLGNPFCTTVSRNPDSTFQDPAVISGGVNFAKQETSGIDFDMSYQYTFANGHTLATRGIATYLIDLNNYIDPTDPTLPNRQKSELGDPELAFNVNVDYGVGPLDVSYNYRYIGKQTIGTYEAQHNFAGNPATNRDQYPRKWYPAVGYHNLRGEFAVNDMVSLFAGIDNVLNTEPPLGLLGTGGGDPFDTTGRYYYGGFLINL